DEQLGNASELRLDRCPAIDPEDVRVQAPKAFDVLTRQSRLAHAAEGADSDGSTLRERGRLGPVKNLANGEELVFSSDEIVIGADRNVSDPLGLLWWGHRDELAKSGHDARPWFVGRVAHPDCLDLEAQQRCRRDLGERPFE